MFRWCSYCQHLMGEVPPLDDFRLTHGICPRCAAAFDDEDPPAPDLLAQRLLRALEAASKSGDFEQAAAAIRVALESGIHASEVLIGILSPALYAIGKLWECGKISVAEEHRFTAFCSTVIDQIAAFERAESPPSLVLAPMAGNTHELGIRMLQHLAWERGLSCFLLPVGASADEIVAAGRSLQPRLFGLSVSASESIPGALELCRQLRQTLPANTGLALGGAAFRLREFRQPATEARVLRTVDEFLEWLEAARSEGSPQAWERNSSPNPP